MKHLRYTDLTGQVIGAAIEVHRALGPGLLESAYDECLARELRIRELPFRRQLSLPLEYKGGRVDNAYRVDYLVDSILVVEIKAVTAIEPVHEAQLLTYMKLGKWPVGLLINFNVALLRSGLRRMTLRSVDTDTVTAVVSIPVTGAYDKGPDGSVR